MIHFVIQGTLHPIESVKGFALRMSEANGYDRPPCTGEELLAADVSMSAEAARCTELPSAIRIEGAARICPECLDEMSFARLHWTIKPYIACHIHGRMLRDACPACQRPLSWRRPALARCSCRASLTLSLEERASPFQLLVARLIDMALVRGTTPPSSPLAGLSLAATTTLSWFFGVDPEATKWRSAFLAKPSGTVLAESVDRAGKFIAGWPSSFERWLERRLQAGGERHLYLSLRRALSAIPGYADALTERAHQFLDRNTSIAPLRKDAFFATRRSWVIASDAAVELGVSNATVASWVDAGQLEARTIKRVRRTIRLVSRQSLDALKTQLAGEIGAAEAMLILNISASQLNCIRRAGIVGAHRRGTWWRYDNSSLQHLLRLLAELSAPLPLTETVPIVGAGRNWRKPLEGVLTAAIAGRTAIFWDQAQTGLRAFHILKPPRAGSDDAGMTFSETAAELRVSQRMIHVLIEANCLTTTFGGARVTIDRSSVRVFNDRFCTSNTLAKATGSNTRTVIARLQAQGVRPRVASDTKKGISSIWERCPTLASVIDELRSTSVITSV